jgi:hypothetical protein
VRLLLVELAIGVILFITSSGCVSRGDHASPSQYSPASERMGALAGMPAESEASPGGVVPNPAPFIDAGTLAAANSEGTMVKTGARAYLSDHPSATFLDSDSLQPPYVVGRLKAIYVIDPLTTSITRVDTVDGGWTGIVFSLSQQRWTVGAADGDHDKDQDIP